MIEALLLTITHFDSMENSVSQAEYISEEHYFNDDSEKTAHAKCAEYLASKTYHPHLGWNQEVYPKIKVTRIFMK